MKQGLFIGTLFFLFLFIVKFFTIDLTDRISPAQFVGPDALVLITQNKLQERMSNYQNSKLVREIRKIDYRKIAKGFGIPEQEVVQDEKIIEKIQNLAKNPIVQELFGEEISLAIYPLRLSSASIKEDEILDTFLLISKPKYFSNIKTLLSKAVGVEGDMSQSNYGAYTIYRFHIGSDRTISAAQVEKRVLITFSERLLRKSIDIYDGEYPQLQNYQPYKKYAELLEPGFSLTYININKLRKNSQDILKIFGVSQNGNLLSFINILTGYKSLFWGIRGTKNKIRQKLILGFELEETNRNSRELLTVIPEKTNSYKKISKDSICYYWTNVFRPLTLFNIFEDISKRNRQGNNTVFGVIKEKTGISSDEFLSYIESDFFLAFKDISQYQFVPFPPVVIAIKTNNPKKIKLIIKILEKHYNLPITTRNQDEIEISYWGETFSNEDMQPTYAVVGNYLVVASNAGQIREFISVSKKKNSLDTNKSFKNVDIGLTGNNNSICYLDLIKVGKLTQELVSWGGTMIGIVNRDTASKTKVLLDYLINPVLDGMSIYSSMGIRSYLKQDCVVVESMTLVDQKE